MPRSTKAAKSSSVSKAAKVKASRSGFARYEAFFSSPPALVIEWHDDQTPAKGWVAINALRGGAAGGGTRMRRGGTREEAVFLAKTMQVKFNVCGPAIGGGKSVIDFDPATHYRTMHNGKQPTASQIHDLKTGVLERWYRHIAPVLKLCYGTGGDVGVDERVDVIPITRRTIGLQHPQEGIVRGHFHGTVENKSKFDRSIKQLSAGVLAKVSLPDLKAATPWTIADVATGWGVVCSLASYYRSQGQKLAGRRVSIEGFGAVGAFAAYYLHHQGAKVVGISSAGGPKDRQMLRYCIDPDGIEVMRAILLREGTELGDPGVDDAVHHAITGDELYQTPADIFITAAISHTITAERIEMLTDAGVKVIACGSNNAFAVPPRDGSGNSAPQGEQTAHMLHLQRIADSRFAIIPDFIANCGMARTFAHLMVPGNKATAEAVLDDIEATMNTAVKKLVGTSRSTKTGLLDCGYQLFID